MADLLMKKDNLIAARAYVEALLRKYDPKNGDPKQIETDHKTLIDLEHTIYRTEPEDMDFESIYNQLNKIGYRYGL